MPASIPASGAQSFANIAAASDAFEIETSRLALANGASAAVKSYANKMIEAHTASTAKLLNRLTSTGHLRRVRHTRDGRSVTVIARPLAHERLRVVMTQPHDRMLEAARRVPEESRQAVLDFLADMTQAFEGTGEPPHQAADRKI